MGQSPNGTGLSGEIEPHVRARFPSFAGITPERISETQEAWAEVYQRQIGRKEARPAPKERRADQDKPENGHQEASHELRRVQEKRRQVKSHEDTVGPRL